MRFRYEWRSPLGPLRLFQEDDALCGLYFQGHSPAPKSTTGVSDRRAFQPTIRQLEEFFASERTEFDIVVTQSGTDFQQSVWSELLQIPFGQTISYQTIANAIDRPRAARAVGAAVARNPISIVIPCHRVVGANGMLTGFAGGIARKQRLLELERAHTTTHG